MGLCTETINCFLKKTASVSIVNTQDLNEEENSESEKSNEKQEKSGFTHDFSCDAFSIIREAQQIRLSAQKNIDFSSSDYSQVVYSPPEII
jgi:hypothetical protein